MKIQNEGDFMIWIIPCNKKYYDVENAFDKLPKIDWKQSTNVQIGDTVYIYVGKPIQAILFKCNVNKVDLPTMEIDDTAYHIDNAVYGNYGRYMELEKVDAYLQGEMTIDKLRSCGFKNNIQGSIRCPKCLENLLKA